MRAVGAGPPARARCAASRAGTNSRKAAFFRK